jgi:hypothetical protein
VLIDSLQGTSGQSLLRQQLQRRLEVEAGLYRIALFLIDAQIDHRRKTLPWYYASLGSPNIGPTILAKRASALETTGNRKSGRIRASMSRRNATNS